MVNICARIPNSTRPIILWIASKAEAEWVTPSNPSPANLQSPNTSKSLVFLTSSNTIKSGLAKNSISAVNSIEPRERSSSASGAYCVTLCGNCKSLGLSIVLTIEPFPSSHRAIALANVDLPEPGIPLTSVPWFCKSAINWSNFSSKLYSSRLGCATGRTTIISQPSENGGHEIVTLKSPTCKTLQPYLSISIKQSLLTSLLFSTEIVNSSAMDSIIDLLYGVISSSTTSNSVMCPRFTLGGQSDFKNTVLTLSSDNRLSRESGIGGWSPNLAINIYSNWFSLKGSHCPSKEYRWGHSGRQSTNNGEP